MNHLAQVLVKNDFKVITQKPIYATSSMYLITWNVFMNKPVSFKEEYGSILLKQF